MTRMRFVIDLQGADRLSRKLNAEALLRDPVKDLIDFGRKEAERHAERRAPRLTGTLAGSVTSELRSSGMLPMAIIRAGATARDGFRYGMALDASDRYHRQRGGRSGRKGAPTKKWFTGVLSLVRTAMRRLERQTTQAIERRWSR